MGNNKKEQGYTKEELEKLPVKEQAMIGMAIGSGLIEEWKNKFKLVWIIRILLIGLVLFGIYKLLQMNGVV